MRSFKIWQYFSDKISSSGKLSRGIMVFGLCLVCYIWIDLYYGIQAEKKIAFEKAFTLTDNMTRTFEEHTLGTIKNVDQTAFFIKQLSEKGEMPLDLAQYVKQGSALNRPAICVRVFGAGGRSFATSQPREMVFDGSRYDYFFVHRDIDSGQLFIGRPVWDPQLGRWSIPMSRRINKPDGSFGGVVALSVDPYYFADLYRQIDLGKDASIVLLGRDGIVRARQAGEEITVNQDLSKSQFIQNLQKGDSGHYVTESPVDGVRRMYAYRALANYPFALLVGVSEEGVLHNINERIFDNCLVATLITLLIAAFTGMLLKVSSRQQLAEQALQAANDNLEDEVRHQTMELSAANEQLVAMNGALGTLNTELREEIAERRRAETELQKKRDEMWHMAYFDKLTGLPNRLHLNEWLAKAMAREGAEGTFLFIDLDELKMVNDSFGHSCGDEIILMIARRLTDSCGEHAFIARTGGDEFSIVLTEAMTNERLQTMVHHIMEVISRKQRIGEVDFHVTASIGSASYPQDGEDVQEIFKNADNAMYAAKRDGKNCWRMYAADMQSEVYERMLLTNSLRSALDEDEFLLHYQPQMDIRTGQTSGFEALIRWDSARQGFVSPGRFIPVAEQSGLIQPIGRWVLKEACRFAKRLETAGYKNLPVAVNVSAQQVAKEDFVDDVYNILKKAGIEARQLEIEITESLLLSSLEESIKKLQGLRELGIKLSLDDFGVGYSSLTYLRQLPVDTLKIDKSFIDMIGVDSKGAGMIGAIIQMAHILGKNVIAEGVEAEEQLAYLAKSNCDCIQGYFFSRPLPEMDVFAFLAARQKGQSGQ